MEAWRQWRLGGQRKNGAQHNETEIPLTPTGLLMEGVSTHDPVLEPSGPILRIVSEAGDYTHHLVGVEKVTELVLARETTARL